MRIRYGKSIKVKSLLGSQNISTSLSPTASWQAFGYKNNGSFTLGGGATEKYLTVDNTHKYFICDSFDPANITTSAFTLYSYSPDAESSKEKTYGTAQYYGNDFACGIISGIQHNGRTNLSFRVSSNINIDLTINYSIIIDLTEIGLDTLTAQEFYNKYNKYFSLIATGEEITIDDKAGQVSLKKLLPDAYQEVEYIEGDGSQWLGEFTTINGTEVDGDLTVCYKFQATVHDRAMYFSTIESTLSAGQAYSLGYTGATGPLYIRWNQIANSTTEVTGYQVGDIVEVTRTNNVQTMLKKYSLFTHGSSSSLSWKGRIYKYWLKIDNTYLFNWIPCYRKSDNAIGLYDLVSGTFRANQGTGTFLKGNNVNNTISCKVAGGSSDIYYGYNQKISNGQFENGTNGTDEWSTNTNVGTFVKDGGGLKWTYTTQGTGAFTILYKALSILPRATVGHKLLYSYKLKTDHEGILLRHQYCYNPSSIDFTLHTEWTEYSGIQEAVSSTSYFQFHYRTNGPVVGDSIWFKDISIIDLTDWFGSGKEPSTVQEFKEKFTKEYYGFCKTPIKLTRYQIEALPNYGYNQRVSSNAININWTYDNSASSSGKYASHTLNSLGTFASNDKLLFMFNGTNNNTDDNSIGFYMVNYNNQKVYFKAFSEGKIVTITQGMGNNLQIGTYIGPGQKLNVNGYVNVINLTEWYGSGNEPTTVDEFKNNFPNKYYPYSKKRLLNKYMINKLIN